MTATGAVAPVCGAARATACHVWLRRAEVLSFLGNSLLHPMTSETSIGLRESFWDAMADELAAARCSHPHATLGVERLKRYARTAANVRKGSVERVAVEYARLFLGPPKPAAPPWETMYAARGRVGEVGFGRATFDMRRLLREAGLAVRGSNNQYPDHMGLELLYMAARCKSFAENPPTPDDERALARFAAEHPVSWAPALREAVEAAAPEGYYRGVVEAVEGACSALA